MKETSDIKKCSNTKNKKEVKMVTKWIQTEAIPFKTVKAGSGFEDLEPLKKLLKGARIIGLGEQTHGTREFFKMKHRMLEFLLKEMGFTLFGIEASLPDSMAVNEYVLKGKGDPSTAIGGMHFWTWNTEEVLDMVCWMRKYNEDPNHEEKLKFYGFDMQHTRTPIRELKFFLKKVDPDYSKQFIEAIEPLPDFPRSLREYIKLPDEKKKAVVDSIQETIQHLEDNRNIFIEKTSMERFELALQHAMILKQAVEMYSAYAHDTPIDIRDKYMALNIKWILDREGPNSKIVLWAHNVHVSLKEWGQGIPLIKGPIRSMGSYLRELYGNQYIVFGFCFGSGSFQAITTDPSEEKFIKIVKGVGEHTVGLPPKGSVGWYMHQAGLPMFILDLRKVPSNVAVANWIKRPHPMRYIGGAFDTLREKTLTVRILPEHFDFLIYIDKTTRAWILPTGPQGPLR